MKVDEKEERKPRHFNGSQKASFCTVDFLALYLKHCLTNLKSLLLQYR